MYGQGRRTIILYDFVNKLCQHFEICSISVVFTCSTGSWSSSREAKKLIGCQVSAGCASNANSSGLKTT